jgi:hypothetical protein
MVTATPAFSNQVDARRTFALCTAVVAALTVVRLVALHFSVVDLYVDESQYWAWSRLPAFGYFSKPPLLAWVIGLAAQVCGNGEACVRAASPLFYFGTTLLCYAIARTLYDARVALWTALTIALAPGVSFSSRIISTDVPLLFFWALALLAYVELRRAPDWRWAATLGVAIGLGLLTKYAMLYFLLSVAIAATFDGAARALLRRPQSWAALAFTAVLVAPNIAWNAAHGFVTFEHTGGNIGGGGWHFDVLQGLEFPASQFAVFGPIAFGALVATLLRWRTVRPTAHDRLMLAFALPLLGLVTAVGFVRGANGNWGAPAFVSGAVVVTAVLARNGAWNWLKAGVAIGAAMQVALVVADTMADRLHVPGIAKGDVYARTMGWRAFGDETARLAQAQQARTVATEGRDEMSALFYYLRDAHLPVLAWPGGTVPDHYFEAAYPLTSGAPEPVLFVSSCGTTARLARTFERVTPLGEFTAPSGPTSGRRFFAFKLEHARGAIAPLGGC